MRTLILGGTVFLGRHAATEALARGHELTLFTRGRHGAIEGAEHLVAWLRDGGEAELDTWRSEHRPRPMSAARQHELPRYSPDRSRSWQGCQRTRRRRPDNHWEDWMRRLQRLVLAVLACALVAVPAQAAKVKTKTVAQDKAAVQDYWTAERMRNAIPADKARSSSAAPKGRPVKGASATQVPPPYTSAPTRTNGKVFFSDGGSNYVCSGTALLSGNRSVVWTAGHCVHDGANDFHTNWAFVPAYADGSRPYGTWAARGLLTTSGWASSGDLSYDNGAAVVSPNGGQALTDVVGGRNIAFNTARNQSYAAHGYPAASPFNGQRLWVCNSGLAYNDTSQSPATMGINCDMTGGSSGGGWISTSGAVVSVNSYGYSTLRNVMFGPYQGSVAQSLYTQAAGS